MKSIKPGSTGTGEDSRGLRSVAAGRCGLRPPHLASHGVSGSEILSLASCCSDSTTEAEAGGPGAAGFIAASKCWNRDQRRIVGSQGGWRDRGSRRFMNKRTGLFS